MEMKFKLRPVIVAQICDELKSALKYELCSYLPSQFDSSPLLRKAKMPALADAIWKLVGSSRKCVPTVSQ